MKHLLCTGIVIALFSCSREKPADTVAPPAPATQGDAHHYLTDCRSLRREAQRGDSLLLVQTDLNRALGDSIVRVFNAFTGYCKSDSLTPVYLIKTAQVARALNNIPEAKRVLDQCIADYPAFDNRPAALFLLATLYDDNTYLNNEEEARRLYEQIINEHPKSDWAASARGALRFVGKSDEQIMRELNQRK